MKRFFVAFGASAGMALAFTGAGVLLARSRPIRHAEAAASEFPMTPLERQTTRSLSQRVAVLRGEIARVASGDKALEANFYQVAEVVQALDRDEEELRREAEKRLGVAVVQSGSAWVTRTP